ncbi:unnamed protein product [Closterium sp. Naga37s-1]|nr:unnamed protein product [Closterium sp. Naga37s-1]
MGRGGQGVAAVNRRAVSEAPAADAKSNKNKNKIARAPSAKPPFTLGDLRRAIPPHCFQRSLLRSSAYLLIDLAFAALFLYATTRFDDIHQLVDPAVESRLPAHLQPYVRPAVSVILWGLYTWLQGCVCTGLWVIAHECGHGAFSDYAFVNDTVGMVVHSWLLVPYFSWKYSHRRHHSNTGSLENDEGAVSEYLQHPLQVFVLSIFITLTPSCPHSLSPRQVFVPARREQLGPVSEYLQHPFGRVLSILVFVPARREQLGPVSEYLQHPFGRERVSVPVFVPARREQLGPVSEYLQHPFGRVLSIFITLTLGWPLYLAFNVSGHEYKGVHANHFSPYSGIFCDRERFWVVVSDLGLLGVLGCLYSLGSAYGLAWVLKVYVCPLLIVNMFLVLITLLQHTHPALPHFDSTEWEWLRGALATVDRDYGYLNIVHHHIADTHVAHHIFSTMPHYHAEEATRAIKPILKDYYQFDGTPIVKALWREVSQCVCVAPDADGPKGVYCSPPFSPSLPSHHSLHSPPFFLPFSASFSALGFSFAITAAAALISLASFPTNGPSLISRPAR